ncbi:hypothetical protein [Pontibacter sp. G13]|uniref:hypothetical protein n=1 Tax=Pontibacter sp. G13 TaxID=3074898 RepID=UPI00288BD84C|nr:hypothetical protein [Pontibacter sp. G13]WNJ17781.1 hypothetical protein RJD25_23255 [Pontibacter sp. G13]
MPLQSEISQWLPIQFIAVEELSPASQELGDILQMLGSVDRSFSQSRDEDRAFRIGWNPQRKTMTGFAGIGDGDPVEISVEPSSHTLHISSGFKRWSLFLKGRTWPEVLVWTRSRLARAGLNPNQFKHESSPQESSRTSTTSQGFQYDHPYAFQSLGEIISNAHFILSHEQSHWPQATPLYFRPENMEFGFDIPIDPSGEQWIGAGLCLGQPDMAGPFYFVQPCGDTKWPNPQLPNLTMGSWYRMDWLGAVLPYEKWASPSRGYEQQGLVSNFLQESIMACRNWMAGTM